MAPEQFAGQAGPASDLYSLGATLLQLVTGQPPSAFPFDSGRIEVPDDLPTDRGIASLIEASLCPAPRDRPRSIEAARALLADPPPPTHARAIARHATPQVPGPGQVPVGPALLLSWPGCIPKELQASELEGPFLVEPY